MLAQLKPNVLTSAIAAAAILVLAAGTAEAQTPADAPNAAATTAPPSGPQQLVGRAPSGAGVRMGENPLPGETLAPAPRPASNSGQARAAAAESVDRGFLTRAVQGAILQNEIGLVEAARGKSASIRQYAMLAAQGFDRTKASLEALATENELSIATMPVRRTSQLRQWLAAAPPAQVDRDYLARALPGLRAEVALFTSESRSGTNPILRQYARKTLPWLLRERQIAARLPVLPA